MTNDNEFHYTLHVTFRARNDNEARWLAGRLGLGGVITQATQNLAGCPSHVTLHLTDGDDWAETVNDQCTCGRPTEEGLRYGGRRWCHEDGAQRDTYERRTADQTDEEYPNWFRTID